MNKNQITMAAIGGVALVAVLAVGYLTYATWEETDEKAQSLERSKSDIRRIDAAPVARTQEAVAAIAANAQKLDDWRAEMMALVSAGDLAGDPDATPESFKQKMVTEARELSKLPGGVAGNIVKDDFDFGFKDYIIGGSMPPRDRLGALQRQWTEIGMLVNLLSRCGVRELVSVEVGAAAAVEAPQKEEKPKRGARNVKKPAAQKEAVRKEPATAQGYELKFTAKPAAFVRVIDACAMVERFIVVDGFSFAKERDTLAEVFGGKEKAEASAGGGRGRGRGRGRNRTAAAADAGQPASEDAEEVSKKGLVIDPELDEPLTVTLKLTTFDFGTNVGEKKDDAAEKEVSE